MGSYYCKMYIDGRLHRKFGGTKAKVNREISMYRNTPENILECIPKLKPDSEYNVNVLFRCYRKNRNGSKKPRVMIQQQYIISRLFVRRKNGEIPSRHIFLTNEHRLDMATFGNMNAILSNTPKFVAHYKLEDVTYIHESPDDNAELSVMKTDVGKTQEKPLKVFLSHPMTGLSDEEVMNIREKAKRELMVRFGNIEIIDNYHHKDAPQNAGRIWHLGRSIQQLEEADAVYFCKRDAGSPISCGARVERLVCKLYGLTVLNDGWKRI